MRQFMLATDDPPEFDRLVTVPAGRYTVCGRWLAQVVSGAWLTTKATGKVAVDIELLNGAGNSL